MGAFDFLLGKKNDPVTRAIGDAIALLEEKNFDEAITVIHSRALAREPDNARAILHLGLCHMLKGEFDTAEQYLSPLAGKKGLDSETALARIALDKIAKDRKTAHGD